MKKLTQKLFDEEKIDELYRKFKIIKTKNKKFVKKKEKKD